MTSSLVGLHMERVRRLTRRNILRAVHWWGCPESVAGHFRCGDLAEGIDDS